MGGAGKDNVGRGSIGSFRPAQAKSPRGSRFADLMDQSSAAAAVSHQNEAKTSPGGSHSHRASKPAFRNAESAESNSGGGGGASAEQQAGSGDGGLIKSTSASKYPSSTPPRNSSGNAEGNNGKNRKQVSHATTVSSSNLAGVGGNGPATATSTGGSAASKRAAAPVLVVSGGGGAFLHGTHVPKSDNIKVFGQPYDRVCAYPNELQSRLLAMKSIFSFRKLNWRFDVIGGIMYVLLVYSCIPLCGVGKQLIVDGSLSYEKLWWKITDVFLTLLVHSNLSSAFFVILLVTFVHFADRSLSKGKRFVLGLVHTLVHSFTAVTLVVLSELAIEYFIDTGIFTHIDWSERLSRGRFVPEFITILDPYTGGLFSWLTRVITSAADVPGWSTTIRAQLCTAGYDSLSRPQHIMFTLAAVVYFWIVAVPVVSFIFGMYLLISVNFLGLHWEEAFSALRLEGFKHFMRFHIRPDGALEAYVIGVERVPRVWTANKHMINNNKGNPSKWVPRADSYGRHGPEPYQPRIIDHFVIEPEGTRSRKRRSSF